MMSNFNMPSASADVRKGALRSICRQLGIDGDGLRDLLGK